MGKYDRLVRKYADRYIQDQADRNMRMWAEQESRKPDSYNASLIRSTEMIKSKFGDIQNDTDWIQVKDVLPKVATTVIAQDADGYLFTSHCNDEKWWNHEAADYAPHYQVKLLKWKYPPKP